MVCTPRRSTVATGESGTCCRGRYKAILVRRDAYLKELCGYIVLNPLRARAVKRLHEWPWSSYAATAGEAEPVPWLALKAVQSLFSGRAAYRRFVAAGMQQVSPWLRLGGQIYLGDEDFLRRVELQLPARPAKGIARSHFHPLRPDAPA